MREQQNQPKDVFVYVGGWKGCKVLTHSNPVQLYKTHTHTHSSIWGTVDQNLEVCHLRHKSGWYFYYCFFFFLHNSTENINYRTTPCGSLLTCGRRVGLCLDRQIGVNQQQQSPKILLVTYNFFICLKSLLTTVFRKQIIYKIFFW